jgi:hypothetical protein
MILSGVSTHFKPGLFVAQLDPGTEETCRTETFIFCKIKSLEEGKEEL